MRSFVMEWQAEERNSLNMQSVILLKFQMNTSVIILSSYRIGIKTLLPKISNPEQFTIPMITAAIILLMNLM